MNNMNYSLETWLRWQNTLFDFGDPQSSSPSSFLVMKTWNVTKNVFMVHKYSRKLRKLVLNQLTLKDKKQSLCNITKHLPNYFNRWYLYQDTFFKTISRDIFSRISWTTYILFNLNYKYLNKSKHHHENVLVIHTARTWIGWTSI